MEDFISIWIKFSQLWTFFGDCSQKYAFLMTVDRLGKVPLVFYYVGVIYGINLEYKCLNNDDFYLYSHYFAIEYAVFSAFIFLNKLIS